MDKNNFFKKDALRPTEEQRLLTKPFYANANDWVFDGDSVIDIYP